MSEGRCVRKRAPDGRTAAAGQAYAATAFVSAASYSSKSSLT